MITILGCDWVQKPTAVALHVILLQIFNITHCHPLKSCVFTEQHQTVYMVKARHMLRSRGKDWI